MNEDIPDTKHNGIEPVDITGQMRRSYLDYAMSVIVSRALPDARDGLKPVHRRILFAMSEAGYTHDRGYRKSARVVGDVIGKYHPHGDSAVYDALVRMAQEFSLGAPLIDGQGNFGSVDGDPAAAMRYTEVRSEKIAAALLADLGKETVDFQDNYDGTEIEPIVLPARFPNLLVNGAGGIAVGMATNVPPHNLGEVIAATTALIDDPDIADEGLTAIVPGPDFPTGALIVGRSGSLSSLLTGRGSIIMRARTEVEEVRGGRAAIIVHELPYQVNKAKMIERIADLARHKQIEGISDIRDESDRHGMRVVIELKRDASADVVLNQLHRRTPMQTSFGANMLALDKGHPRLLSLRQILQAFITFREEVVARRTRYDLDRARTRAHVLIGMAVAVANIDRVIAIIRAAPDPAAARAGLLERTWPAEDMAALIALVADRRTQIDANGHVRLSPEQAKAILDLRLQRLTALGRGEIDEEANTLGGHIATYLEILGSRERILSIIRTELSEIGEKFSRPRRSEFVEAALDLEDEAFIEREEMVVVFTHRGYVKRTALNIYRMQRRGGKGRAAMGTKDEDAVTGLFVGDTHTELLFFSSAGMVYRQKVWRIPEGSPRSRGKALVNLLPLGAGETITSVVALPATDEEREARSIVFSTRHGLVRRNRLADFTNVHRSGKIAMKFTDETDAIVDVRLCTEDQDILLTSAIGRCIRFSVGKLRVFAGRSSTGVRGIRLEADDHVIAMSILSGAPASAAEIRAYLKQRRAESGDSEIDGDGEDESEELDETDEQRVAISAERSAELAEREQFILTATDHGMGKRASSYDYRTTGRGGKGLIAHRLPPRGRLVGSFAVEDDDAVMLSTEAGQMIRCPARQIRIAGRATQGVRLLRTGADDKVSSVAHLVNPPQDDDLPDQDDQSNEANMGDAVNQSEHRPAPTSPDDA